MRVTVVDIGALKMQDVKTVDQVAGHENAGYQKREKKIETYKTPFTRYNRMYNQDVCLYDATSCTTSCTA